MAIDGLPLPVSASSATLPRRAPVGSLSSRLPLKLPLSFSRESGHGLDIHSHSSARPGSLSNLLLSRARTTNLAVLILSSVCCFSLYLNIRAFFSPSASPQSPFSFLSQFSSPVRTYPVPPGAAHLTRLVLVPGHAIYIGADARLRDPLQPTEWILEPYQASHPASSIGAFLNHIRTAVATAADDPAALLVYSGGQTRRLSNETTEGASYSRLANQLGLHDQLPLGTRQTTTEEYALDSWTNLLYSLSRFKEYTGRYPTDITVVGHAVKAKRFKELHRRALRWPLERFRYIGLEPPDAQDDVQNQRMLFEGERAVYLSFERDLYSCHGQLLEKRKARNPFRRFHPYRDSCPEIKDLLDWCPVNGIQEFEGPLPWSTS